MHGLWGLTISTLLVAFGSSRAANLPSCATRCISGNQQGSCTDPTSASCLCQSRSFISTIQNCWCQSCSFDDAQAALATLQSVCSGSGVAIPQAPCAGAGTFPSASILTHTILTIGLPGSNPTSTGSTIIASQTTTMLSTTILSQTTSMSASISTVSNSVLSSSSSTTTSSSKTTSHASSSTTLPNSTPTPTSGSNSSPSIVYSFGLLEYLASSLWLVLLL